MKRLNLFLRWLIAAIAVVMLAGCASKPEVVNHGFSYHFIQDSPDAELLDYRYGTSYYGTSELKQMGRVSQGRNVHGDLRRGDDLYVKWRLKNTGEVLEDTVDLKSRLPDDIVGCDIYFMVRGPQLYVYLITPQRRAKDEPPNGPDKWSFRRILTLYPDQPKASTRLENPLEVFEAIRQLPNIAGSGNVASLWQSMECEDVTNCLYLSLNGLQRYRIAKVGADMTANDGVWRGAA